MKLLPGMTLRTVTLGLLLGLSGCQILTLASGPDSPPLVPPQQDRATLQLSQRLMIRMPDGQTRRMLAVTTLASDRLQLNGLSSTGQRLLEVRWDGDELATWQAPGMEKSVPARWLLAQIQLAYLPATVLHRHYRDNWSLQTDTGKRHLLLEGESHITVTCRAPFSDGNDCLLPGTSVLIDHHRSGIFVRVDTLKVVEKSPGRATSGRPSATGLLMAARPERSRP